MKPASPSGAVTLESRDRNFLDRAVSLGRNGWGRVHPNPLVGCVIVRDDRVVGEGWHAEYGGPHAETVALGQAGELARGAEVFVSLEPCRHEGQTPPCTRALLAAGVSRVVFGALDPGERSGGGGEELRSGGVEVVGPGLTEAEARWENPFFFHRKPGRPWTALKLAVSLDACISGAEGVRTTLSGEEAVREVHRLRAGFDAILVGTRTALVDDPALTVRGPVDPRLPPRRIVIDTRGRTSRECRLLQEEGGAVWFLTTPASPEDWRGFVREKGARVLELPAGPDGRISLRAAMGLLWEKGLRSVLCEGGGLVGSALLHAGLVDRLYLVVAPVVLGAKGVPAFPDSIGSEGGRSYGRGREWTPGEEPRCLGHDIWIALTPREG